MKNNDPQNPLDEFNLDDFELDDMRENLEEKSLPYVEVFYNNDIIYRGFLIDVVLDDFDKESSHYAVSCINGEMVCVPMFDEKWRINHFGIDKTPTPFELAKKELDILCTERTAYEMLSLGFFSGFLIGFFGMFFLSWMIF